MISEAFGTMTWVTASYQPVISKYITERHCIEVEMINGFKMKTSSNPPLLKNVTESHEWKWGDNLNESRKWLIIFSRRERVIKSWTEYLSNDMWSVSPFMFTHNILYICWSYFLVSTCQKGQEEWKKSVNHPEKPLYHSCSIYHSSIC